MVVIRKEEKRTLSRLLHSFGPRDQVSSHSPYRQLPRFVTPWLPGRSRSSVRADETRLPPRAGRTWSGPAPPGPGGDHIGCTSARTPTGAVVTGRTTSRPRRSAPGTRRIWHHSPNRDLRPDQLLAWFGEPPGSRLPGRIVGPNDGDRRCASKEIHALPLPDRLLLSSSPPRREGLHSTPRATHSTPAPPRAWRRASTIDPSWTRRRWLECTASVAAGLVVDDTGSQLQKAYQYIHPRALPLS